MANNKTTAVQDNAVKELVVDAHFLMKSYDKKDKDGNKIAKVDYVELELIEPFGKEEPLRNVVLKAKWDQEDKFGRCVRPDRVFSLMKYYAKKALRTESEIKVKSVIRPVTYMNKRIGKTVTYPAIFVDPTFIELEDESPVEVVLKDPDEQIAFTDVAGRKLGIEFMSRENPDELDMGLME